MEESPTDSVDTSGLTILTIRKGYSFRVMPVDDKQKTYINTVLIPKPEVTMSENPSVKVTPITIPITTKKPIKL